MTERIAAAVEHNATGGPNAQVMQLVFPPGWENPPQPERAAFWLSAVSIAVSVVCAFYAFEAGRQQSQAVYWLQRNEAFLEQLSSQGIKVPPDLLTHKETAP
jgi:hypothetical protein